MNDEETRSWEELCVRRARQGEVAALGELYDAYAARLYRCVLYPAVGDAAQAEDLLAETFRTAFAKIGSFEARGVSIYFWLARIAHNKAMDLHRRRQAQSRALQSFATLVLPLEQDAPSPEQELALGTSRAATSTRVQSTLSSLTERYRQAIELRFFQELPRAECAARMQVKVGTFDVVLLRALRAFRKSWTAAADDPYQAAEASGE